MPTACYLALAAVNSPKPTLFHHGWSFNHRHHSSKRLSLLHFQNEDQPNSSPVVVHCTENPEVTRRPLTDFNPCVWDAPSIFSLSSDFVSEKKPDTWSYTKIEELKKELKNILSSAVTDPSEQLVFIDKIQRLGIAYHFEFEIDNALQLIYDNTDHANGDLRIVALRFRLLRQARHIVSPGVFSKFKDEKGEFLASIRHDVEGLLSLYEAAHLGCKGENILEEAIAFTTQNLKSLARQLNLNITSEVGRSLILPLHKRIARVEATYYMSLYENLDGSEDDVLLQLAKLDYNELQMLHRAEINQLQRWWKELDIGSKLPFKPRDRLVENYVVVMSIMHEPKYSTGRVYLSKLFALLTIMDDIFDVYGTIDELQPITDTISRSSSFVCFLVGFNLIVEGITYNFVNFRWDKKDTDDLPGFAKVIVGELYAVMNELEEEMETRGVHYVVPYFKSEVQHYMRCLLDEAKLFQNKRVPTLEEWLKISITTIGVSLVIVGSVLSHWDLVTKEVMDWFISETKINYSSGRCGRLLGDIHTFKLEQKRGNMASSVTCYMKEHEVQEDEAIECLKKIVNEEWKVMNSEYLKPTTIPLHFLMTPLNMLRTTEFFYMYGDYGYTNSEGHTKEMIASLLVNHIPS